MLGGSIGIAITAALLAAKQREDLLSHGIMSLAEMQRLPANMRDLTKEQQAAVRGVYNDTFTETMRICAIVASIGVIVSMGTFRKSRRTLTTQRYQQIEAEMARRQKERQRKEPASSTSSGRSA